MPLMTLEMSPLENTAAPSIGQLQAIESGSDSGSSEDMIGCPSPMLQDPNTNPISDIPIDPAAQEVSDKVLAILRSYSPAPRGSRNEIEPHNAIVDTVRWLVQTNAPIHLILPAFPFKSPNRIEKVLGALPDMSEEIALARLDGLCSQIREVYPQTSLSIISDGLVYNGLWEMTHEIEAQY